MLFSLSLISSITLALSLVHQVTSTTYWVDTASCTGDKDVTNIIKETQSMASSAKEKLDKDSDTDFANVFKFIFKVDKSDAKTNSAVSSMLVCPLPSIVSTF